jgi:putative SOS response-associated peptidase YedK
MRDHDWFCIAGIWRSTGEGEAFTMLTTEPGEDIKPYHRRQIVPLPRDSWADWLDPSVPATEVLSVMPKGSLIATQVYPPISAQQALL